MACGRSSSSYQAVEHKPRCYVTVFMIVEDTGRPWCPHQALCQCCFAERSFCFCLAAKQPWFHPFGVLVRALQNGCCLRHAHQLWMAQLALVRSYVCSYCCHGTSYTCSYLTFSPSLFLWQHCFAFLDQETANKITIIWCFYLNIFVWAAYFHSLL